MEINENILDWIETNAKADTAALRLKHAGDATVMDAILQIDCRRKAATKLPDTLKCREFWFPTALSAEQCTSDALADFHSTLVRGDRVLDMTCGLCIDAFHIAATGKHVTAIDINPEITEAARHNARALGIESFEAITADCTQWIQTTPSRFDTIFIDPARRGEGGKRIFALSDCTPDVVAMLPLLRQRCTRLIIKASPMLDIKSIVASLAQHCDIFVTGTRTECKEIVAVIDFDREYADTTVTAFTVGAPAFTFALSEESSLSASFCEPAEGMFLYEPFPAMMKAGGFSSLCQRFGVNELAQNTHLFVSSSDIPDFPGERFIIKEILPFNKKTLKEISSTYTALDISARNFIIPAPELAKRLKIKQGGHLRLFAATTQLGNTLMITST
ncbi:MAG: class I SAM-dependent methyltransferase [Paramuribaculum sp.]|nr:class I SAM-dependent methyltransferase [Paramuribaculum sp.]